MLNKNPINVSSFVLEETNQIFFTPENDIIFRTIFGSVGNEHLTKAMLQSIYDENIENIQIQSNTNYKINHVLDKPQASDVRAICMPSGKKIILEMQNNPNETDRRRFVTYTEKAHLEDLKKGIKYTDLKKVDLIVIASKNMYGLTQIDKYLSVWNNREKDYSSYIFCDDITIYVVELSKYIAEKNQCAKENKNFKINPWIEFFINPLGKEVENAMRTQEELREAVDLLKKLNQDDEVRTIAEREEQIEFDRMARINDAMAIAMADGLAKGIAEGRTKGMAEGRAEGRVEGRAAEMTEIIVKFVKSGMKIEEIAKILERNPEELKKIIANNMVSA